MKAQERKGYPVYTGLVKYFPLALIEISRCSQVGNDQHHPDTELHWDREKSGDELDAMMRHMIDHSSGDIYDDDGVRHLCKVAWRALAALQKAVELEIDIKKIDE